MKNNTLKLTALILAVSVLALTGCAQGPVETREEDVSGFNRVTIETFGEILDQPGRNRIPDHRSAARLSALHHIRSRGRHAVHQNPPRFRGRTGAAGYLHPDRQRSGCDLILRCRRHQDLRAGNK